MKISECPAKGAIADQDIDNANFVDDGDLVVAARRVKFKKSRQVNLPALLEFSLSLGSAHIFPAGSGQS